MFFSRGQTFSLGLTGVLRQIIFWGLKRNSFLFLRYEGIIFFSHSVFLWFKGRGEREEERIEPQILLRLLSLLMFC